MRHFLLGSLLVALSSPLLAADTLIARLPPEVMERLEPNTQLSADIPSEFPISDFPAGLTLVGSFGQQPVFSVLLSEDASDAQSQLDQSLNVEGWQLIPSRRPILSVGFIGPPRRPRPLIHCHDSQPGNLNVERISTTDGGYVLLSYGAQRNFMNLDGSTDSCRTRVEKAQRSAGFNADAARDLSQYMPRLELPGLDDPDGSPTPRSSGLGGSINEQTATMEVSMDTTLEALGSHFHTQLQTQGWTIQGSASTPDLATSIWTRPIDNSTTLSAVLTLAKIGDNQFNLQFRAVRQGF